MTDLSDAYRNVVTDEAISKLVSRGLVYPTERGWALTENGKAVAREIERQDQEEKGQPCTRKT